MGILLSSCAPRLHSKISYLKDNYKDFEISSSPSTSWIKKINNNLETDSKNFNNAYEDYRKSNKFDISINLDESDFSNKIRPKNMPRYDFESLKNEIFANEIIPENRSNMSVVLMHSIMLEGSDSKKIYLPLGTVLNVIHKQDNWLYVQTPEGHEGYVDYKTCTPLGILLLPSTKENQKISTPRGTHDGNIIATEKIINMNNFNNSKLQCTERDFDLLYLQVTRNNVQSKDYDKDINKVPLQNDDVEQKTVILIIKTDYMSRAKNTLNVKKGDVVFLIHCCVKGWFWVRNEHNTEGFIPSATAGYLCT